MTKKPAPPSAHHVPGELLKEWQRQAKALREALRSEALEHEQRRHDAAAVQEARRVIDQVATTHLRPWPSPKPLRIGRPPVADPAAVKAELKRRRDAREKTSHGALAQHFGVSKATIGRYLKK